MTKDFLLNKNILITGATSGIGKSLTKYLSEHGANILMLSKDESKLDVLYDEIVKKYNTDPCIFKCDLQKINEAINADPGVCLITVPYALSRLTSENGKDHLAEIAQLLMEERNFGRSFDALHAQSFINGVHRSLTDSFTATQEDRVRGVGLTS